MIVCIPTKGRPDTQTYKLFTSVGIDVFHFIEPQEESKYKVPNKIIIDKNNRGITYARNYIFDWCRAKGNRWVIICDDDVKHFGIVENKRCKKTDAGIWRNILKDAQSLSCEVFGIDYRQYAWSRTKKANFNTGLTEVCLLYDLSKISWKFSYNTKEDRDFLLKTIKYGNGVVRFNRYFYSCPTIGTNKGGLHKEYANNKDEQWSLQLRKDWGKYVTIVNKRGRIDAKIHWRKFAIDNNKVVI